MPDTRTHRGPHPQDARLFGPAVCSRLRGAASDLAWLLNHGYPSNSSLKLVGDRYRLTARQRTAVSRSTCSDDVRAHRTAHCTAPHRLAGRTLLVDGYNVLTTVEVALGGGVVLAARDTAFRDMAGMHGTYRKVAETTPALERLGRVIAAAGVSQCLWYLDRPVSNSGRLKRILEQTAADAGWSWRVELVPDPDPLLADARHVVATADSAILDRCRAWFNLARETIVQHVPQAWIVDFRATPAEAHTHSDEAYTHSIDEAGEKSL